MTSVSADPIVIHAMASLAVVRVMHLQDWAKGSFIDRFSRRAMQAI
jgi:hypothetical protein